MRPRTAATEYAPADELLAVCMDAHDGSIPASTERSATRSGTRAEERKPRSRLYRAASRMLTPRFATLCPPIPCQPAQNPIAAPSLPGCLSWSVLSYLRSRPPVCTLGDSMNSCGFNFKKKSRKSPSVIASKVDLACNIGGVCRGSRTIGTGCLHLG